MEVYNLFVSSENRDTDKYPSGNSYTLHLPTILHNVSKVEILYADVPNTIYNVTDGSNVISLSNTSTSSGGPLVDFSIPLGFYDGCGLANEITNAVYPSTNVKLKYLSDEGKFLISRPIGNPTFTCNVNTSELQELLKLGPSTNSQTPPTGGATATYTPLYVGNLLYYNKNFIKSNEVVSLQPEEGIFLDIEELRSTFNRDATKLESNTFVGETMTRSFGMIPLDVNSGGIKQFKKATDYDFGIEYPYPIQSLDRLTVSWVTRLGNNAHFNGADSNSFLLRIYTDFEKEGIQEIPEPPPPVVYERAKHFNLFTLAGVVLIIGLIMLLLIRR